MANTCLLSTYRAAARAAGECFGPAPSGPRPASISALTAQDHSERADDDLHVGAQGPALDVVTLEPHNFFEIRDEIPSVHLPGTSEAWYDAEANEMAWFVSPHLTRQRRPRSDERHVTGQDIEDLGELVEAEAAQEPSHARDPRIRAQFEQPAVAIRVQVGDLILPRFGFVEHAPELPHHELAGTEPHASLPEKHRAPRLDLDGDRDQEHEGRGDDEPDAGEHEIAGPFENQRRQLEPRRMQMIRGQASHARQLGPSARRVSRERKHEDAYAAFEAHVG